MYFLANIGASFVKIGLSQNLNKIEKTEIYPTPYKYQDFLKLIENENKKFNQSFLTACFGFPGVFNQKKEKLIYAPNLKDYQNKNLKRDLKRILKTKIILENDADLEGLGEVYFGSGKNFQNFGYLTLGTGLGGVRIIDKKIDKNLFGFEPGHSYLILQENLFEAEDILSGKGLKNIFGKEAKEIQNKRIWQSFEQILAVFLVNVSLFWSVDKIILNGSLVKSLNIKRVQRYVNKIHPLPIKVDILKSKLKEKAGIYGALVKCQSFI